MKPRPEFSRATIDAARMGRSWPLLEVKQGLNAALSEGLAFAAYVELLGLPAAARLRVKKLESLHAAAIGQPGYREIEAGGKAFELVPPRVIGTGNHRILHGRARTLYAAGFENACTRGRSGLVERENDVLLDFEGDEFDRIDDEVTLDSAIFAMAGRNASIVDRGEPGDIVTVEEAFSLLGPNSFAFGHWIGEYLPKLVCAMEWGRLPPMPVLIDQGMPRQHRQALELLLAKAMTIIEVEPHQVVEAGRLWVASTYFYAPHYPLMNARYHEDLFAASPARFAAITAAMNRGFDREVPPEDGDARLYLARKSTVHRLLVNHQEIEALAVTHGFRICSLEELDFAEQLRLVRSARNICGPEGSAFFVAFFAKPGTKLGFLNHIHTEMLTGVTALCDAVGMETSVLTGPFHHERPDYPHFGDYMIEPEVFAAFLGQWIS